MNKNNIFAVLLVTILCVVVESMENEHDKMTNAAGESGESAKKEKKEPKSQKSKKKAKEDGKADEMDEVAEPKFKDPLAALPSGTFSMDAFKRVYSNQDTATVAIPYFWANFDPEHYSIWYAEYKYPEELTLVYRSCNLIGGMFQRLEKLRKTAFASVCLFGTDNNSTISGIWIWRGQNLAFELSPDWQDDYESYEWKKLDPTDEHTKKLVNEYLLWEKITIAYYQKGSPTHSV